MVGIYKTSTIPFVSRSADFTHGTAIVLIWLVAEVTATIIAASIPFFRPLIRRAAGSKRNGKESYGMSSRANRSGGGWGSHDKLGSQADIKGDPSSDYNSDIDMIGSTSKIVRQTNITVEFDTYSPDKEREEQRNGRGHRDMV